MQGAQVRSLVGELRSHMPHQGTKIPLLSAAKKKKKKGRLKKKRPTESPAKSRSRGSHRNLSAGPRQIKQLGGASSSLPRLASCLVRPLVLEEFWVSFIIRAASIFPDIGPEFHAGEEKALQSGGTFSLSLQSHQLCVGCGI